MSVDQACGLALVFLSGAIAFGAWFLAFGDE